MHVWIHIYVFACMQVGTRVWRLGVDGQCLPLSLSPFLLTGSLTNWLDREVDSRCIPMPGFSCGHQGSEHMFMLA